MARKLKIMENEKHPLDDLKNDEITVEYVKKTEKWKTPEGPTGRYGEKMKITTKMRLHLDVK